MVNWAVIPTQRLPEGRFEAASAPRPAAEHILVLGAVGLALRLWFIHQYPVIFGGDTVLRQVCELMLRDRNSGRSQP